VGVCALAQNARRAVKITGDDVPASGLGQMIERRHPPGKGRAALTRGCHVTRIRDARNGRHRRYQNTGHSPAPVRIAVGGVRTAGRKRHRLRARRRGRYRRIFPVEQLRQFDPVTPGPVGTSAVGG